MSAKPSASSPRSPKTKVRVAMVGAGSQSNWAHYPSLASFADVEFAGICDLIPQRLNTTGDKYHIANRYTDYQKMIQETQPDGVYVIGNPDVMYPLWQWCLEQGLNLFIEKPMGLTWHQARMLADLAARKGVITQVGHQRRSSPLLKKVREECLKKGPITYASCEFYKCSIAPSWGPRDHMMDDCVHSIDTVRWMCGGEVVEIESHCRRIATPDINFICATLRFDNGSTGYLVNCWAAGRRTFRVQMQSPGVCADAEVEAKAVVYEGNNKQGVTYDCFEVAGGKTTWEAFGFRDKNREFIDSLKTGKELTTSPFRDCVKTMEVAEKILAKAVLRGE